MQKLTSILLCTFICFSMSSCAMLEEEIATRKEDKEYCALNENNASKFMYGGNEHLILSETTSRDNLGAWVGYIQKYAMLDEEYAVLDLRDIDADASHLQNLPEDTAYVVQFFNIYTGKENELVVDVNGGLYKAVPVAQSNGKLPIVFETNDSLNASKVSINPTNCTQILIGESRYQITETEIERSKLRKYLGVIGQHKVFDLDTLLEIPRDELNQMEVLPDELTEQNRVSWYYGLVYATENDDTSVAIQINNVYKIANLVE